MIEEYKTVELVDELSRREGVERIDVDVLDICDLAITDVDSEITYDSLRRGPEIILRVID